MKKSLAFAALLFTGCISAPFQPPSGIVSITKAPLSTEGNWKAGLKHGSSKSQSVLGIYAWGDCSITAAAANAGLRRIDYVDYEYVNIIGVWQEAIVHAYGE